MRIQVASLPKQGLTVTVENSDSWVNGAGCSALIEPPETLQGELNVCPIGPGLRVVGSLVASIMKECDACLDGVRIELGGDLDLYYETPPKALSGEVELDADALDVGFFNGEELDLALVVSEYLALQLPIRIRCGETGVHRLFEGECMPLAEQFAAEETIDPRLAPLQKLKFNN